MKNILFLGPVKLLANNQVRPYIIANEFLSHCFKL